MSVLQLGDTITMESTAPEGIRTSTFFYAVSLDGDGSRRAAEKHQFDLGSMSDNIKRAIIAAIGPKAILWGQYPLYPVTVGEYLPYVSNTDPRVRPAEPVPTSPTPTNQIPFILHLKKHLGNVAHEFVTDHAIDIFQHEANTDTFSPHNIVLTSDQQNRFELANKNIRRLVGVLWERTGNVAGVNPTQGESNWKTAVRNIWAQVDLLCSTCSGRGWKRRILRNMNVTAWQSRFSADTLGAFFVNTSVDGSWGVGDPLRGTGTEYTAAIANFVKALKYHEETTGAEDSHGVTMDMVAAPTQ